MKSKEQVMAKLEKVNKYLFENMGKLNDNEYNYSTGYRNALEYVLNLI